MVILSDLTDNLPLCFYFYYKDIFECKSLTYEYFSWEAGSDIFPMSCLLFFQDKPPERNRTKMY